MGAPAAFEHRRQELAEMSAKSSAEVNDNEEGVTFRQGGRVGTERFDSWALDEFGCFANMLYDFIDLIYDCMGWPKMMFEDLPFTSVSRGAPELSGVGEIRWSGSAQLGCGWIQSVTP